MKFLHNCRRASAVAVAMLCTTATTSQAIISGDFAHRPCVYEIRAKAEQIRSFTIAGGRVEFVGYSSKSPNPIGYARYNAARFAYHCFRSAVARGVNRNQIPSACRANTPGGPGSTYKVSTSYRITGLKSAALQQVCQRARNQNLQRLTNFKVYTFLPSRSRDVRRECSLPPSPFNVPDGSARLRTSWPSPYKTFATTLSVGC